MLTMDEDQRFSLVTPDMAAIQELFESRDASPAALLKNQQQIASWLLTITEAVELLEKLITQIDPQILRDDSYPDDGNTGS